MAEALQLAAGDLVASIRRIRLAGGRPISLDHAHFPAGRFPCLLERPLGGTLYELLKQEYNTQPAEAVESFEIASATEEEASLLDIAEGDPLLLIRRTSYDVTGASMRDAPFTSSWI